AHPNDCVSYVVRITSESNPRDARLIARRSNGSALHTLDHQFSKSRAQKTPAQTPMLTACPDPGQGGRIIEDTARRPPRPPPPPPPRAPPRIAPWPDPHPPGKFTPPGALPPPPRPGPPPPRPRPA